MKNFCKKLSDILKTIFGWGILIALFAGGLTFFGYVIALCIGGSVGTAISLFLYQHVLTWIIYLSVVMVLLGLVAMYLAGEVALTPGKKKAKKHEGEV